MFRYILRSIHLPVIYPFYHIVSDREVAHIKHLYPVTSVQKFEQELDVLLKHYQPIAIEDVFQVIQQQKTVQQPSFHLTFDDGLRECYDTIAPILLRKGIPASFFINSNFVDNQAMLYRMKVSLLIEQGNYTERNIQQFKAYTYTESSLLDAEAEKQGISFNDYLKEHQPYMTSSQIQQLYQQGFHIGAHSHNHPYYATISLEEQLKETRQSLAFVQKLLQPTIKTFAFPFDDVGVSNTFFDQLGNEVDVWFTSGGIKNDERNNVVRRLPLERQADLTKYLYKKYLKYFLKNKLRYKHIHTR